MYIYIYISLYQIFIGANQIWNDVCNEAWKRNNTCHSKHVMNTEREIEREPNTPTFLYICVDNPNSKTVQRRKNIIYFLQWGKRNSPVFVKKNLVFLFPFSPPKQKKLEGSNDEKARRDSQSPQIYSRVIRSTICSTIYTKSVTKVNPHEMGHDIWHGSNKILQLTTEPPLCIFQVLLHLFLRDWNIEIGTYHQRCSTNALAANSEEHSLGTSCKNHNKIYHNAITV